MVVMIFVWVVGVMVFILIYSVVFGDEIGVKLFVGIVEVVSKVGLVVDWILVFIGVFLMKDYDVLLVILGVNFVMIEVVNEVVK